MFILSVYVGVGLRLIQFWILSFDTKIAWRIPGELKENCRRAKVEKAD
jgi:hypothetical protein